MAAAHSPFGCASRCVAELAGLDRPRSEFRHMVDPDIGLHLFFDEGHHIGSRDPGRTETSRDVGGPKVGRLDVS